MVNVKFPTQEDNNQNSRFLNGKRLYPPETKANQTKHQTQQKTPTPPQTKPYRSQAQTTCRRPGLFGAMAGPRQAEHVTPRVTFFSNYLHYKLSQASSVMVDQVIENRNQNSKSGVRILSLFCLVWTDIPSQQIFRIYWSQIRPCYQKRICSP
jgi:hypothetical protein